MLNLYKRFGVFFHSGSQRTLIVKRNAFASLIIKLFSMFIDFAKVPILLSYLDSERYGLYVTIASIVYWTHNFDLGLGTGLRYKLTSAISRHDFIYGKQLVSTAYFTMSVIMVLLLLLLLPIIAFLDWNVLLNTSIVTGKELVYCISIVLIIFVFQFVLELITYVLQAYQKAALSTVFKPIANFVTLLIILILRIFSYNSLLYACLAMTIPIVLVLFICNIYYFKGAYREVSPCRSAVKKECLRDVYSLGLKFFVSQLSNLVVFQTASFLISHYVNPAEAAAYNSAFTYFGVIVIFNTLMLQPLAAAVTDAYVKSDYVWLKNIFSKINRISLLLSLLSIVLLLISPIVFRYWIGDRLAISLPMSICLTIYFILNIWTTPYSSFISGVGKMNIAMILGILKIVLYLPVAIIFVKLFDTTGIIISIIIINTLPNNVVYHIQYKLIVNKTAKGIWNK